MYLIIFNIIDMNRHQFLKTSLISTAAIVTTPFSVIGANNSQEEAPLDKVLVQKFVGASHSKLDVVKTLLEENPTLVNAAHDWKNGDFETGLGAASHVGHKALVQFLLDHGAQANVFTAALFGRMDILKPMIEFSPKTLFAKGPHGFTLLHHAEKGGDDALEVKDYLLSKGLKETQWTLF